jgi:hypothetical protein
LTCFASIKIDPPFGPEPDLPLSGVSAIHQPLVRAIKAPVKSHFGYCAALFARLFKVSFDDGEARLVVPEQELKGAIICRRAVGLSLSLGIVRRPHNLRHLIARPGSRAIQTKRCQRQRSNPMNQRSGHRRPCSSSSNVGKQRDSRRWRTTSDWMDLAFK